MRDTTLSGVRIIKPPPEMYPRKDFPMPKKGNLSVICGPMFSGKSRELIRLIHIAEIAGQNTAVFKPRIDTRYSFDDVASHDGIRKHAHSVETAREILAVLATYPRL